MLLMSVMKVGMQFDI